MASVEWLLAETKEAANVVGICHLWPNQLRSHGPIFDFSLLTYVNEQPGVSFEHVTFQ